MKKTLYVVLILALAVTFARIVSAQNGSAQAPWPFFVSVDQDSGTATVTAVDQTKRTVTLKGPDGDTETYTVSPDVTNLQQVKPGDKLTAVVSEKLAVYDEAGGSKPSAYEVLTFETAPQGAKPGFIATDTVTAIGVVEKIDYNNGEIKVKGPYETDTYQVDPSMPGLKNIKKGDDIVAQYTETLTVYVQ